MHMPGLVPSLKHCTAHPQHLFKRVNLGLDINKMTLSLIL